MPRETSAERKAGSIDSPADKSALKLCTLCFPSMNHIPPCMICSHMIDPENRLFYQLTAMKNWNHDQAREAIQAYAEFMTLKIVRNDYDALILSPTSVIDEVWHAHVLDTKSYQSFNARYLGAGQLIHHDPLKAMDDKGRQNRCKNTILAYGSYFHRTVPEKCNSWSYESSVVDKSDLLQVFVKGLEGKTYTIEVNLTKNGDTVDDLKRKITAICGIPEDVQRLIYAGRQLKDGRFLHGILDNECTVHLVLRLQAC